jgi:PmbA protein
MTTSSKATAAKSLTASQDAASEEAIALLESLFKRAQAQGADAADALLGEAESLGVSYRLGELEDVSRSEARDLGLRVIVGRKQAVVSTTDHSKASLEALVDRAVAMAKVAPDDPYCGLADPELLLKGAAPDLDTYDSHVLDTETLIRMAAEAEDAARAVKGVTNSEGAGAEWGAGRITLATSAGFANGYKTSSFGVSVSVLAGEGVAMERDYDYSSKRHLIDLESPATVGTRAGERAVKRLNPKRAKTAQVPIVFDPRVSGGLVRHLAGAVNGQSISRKSSFLRDKMGQPIFAKGIRIIDDPLRIRGLASKPFDGEGVATAPTVIIEDGVLKTWILDTATAKQLGLKTNGHAARGTGAPPVPGTTNLYLEAGRQSVKDMLGQIKSGFYVAELIGMGVNGVTGDYSRGAAGFWIENGELAYPVNEVTIAGNLKDMFLNLTPADDLEFRYGTDAPTVVVEGMMVAGG